MPFLSPPSPEGNSPPRCSSSGVRTKMYSHFSILLWMFCRFFRNCWIRGSLLFQIKIHLVTLSACQVGFDGVTPGTHPFVAPFSKGVRRPRPVVKLSTPSWDLLCLYIPLVPSSLRTAPWFHGVPMRRICLRLSLQPIPLWL